MRGPKRLCNGGCGRYYCTAHALRVHGWNYCMSCLQKYIKMLEERGTRNHASKVKCQAG